MWSSNAHPQSTGAPEPHFKSSMCFPWMCSASSTKCTCTILLAWSCSAGDKWSVRSSWWAGTSQNCSTMLDRPGACTVSLRDFCLCQGWDRMKESKVNFCIKDKAFAWQICGTFLSCVTLCESLCASISLFIKCKHWYSLSLILSLSFSLKYFVVFRQILYERWQK